jgi:hypothetical protein
MNLLFSKELEVSHSKLLTPQEVGKTHIPEQTFKGSQSQSFHGFLQAHHSLGTKQSPPSHYPQPLSPPPVTLK